MRFKVVQTFYVILSIVFCLQVSTFAQIKKSNKITKSLKTYLDKANVYGFSGQILVTENGKILLNQAYGLADREKKIPNTRSTVFNIASFTKQFTATAILRLEADGKLKTTDAISKYFDNKGKIINYE